MKMSWADYKKHVESQGVTDQSLVTVDVSLMNYKAHSFRSIFNVDLRLFLVELEAKMDLRDLNLESVDMPNMLLPGLNLDTINHGYINDYGQLVPNKCQEIGLDGIDYDKVGMLLHPGWRNTPEVLKELNEFVIPNCACTKVILPVDKKVSVDQRRILFHNPLQPSTLFPTRWVVLIKCPICHGTGTKANGATDQAIKEYRTWQAGNPVDEEHLNSDEKQWLKVDSRTLINLDMCVEINYKISASMKRLVITTSRGYDFTFEQKFGTTENSDIFNRVASYLIDRESNLTRRIKP